MPACFFDEQVRVLNVLDIMGTILLKFWGARIRTWECGDQNPVPYRLATPQLDYIFLKVCPFVKLFSSFFYFSCVLWVLVELLWGVLQILHSDDTMNVYGSSQKGRSSYYE